MCFPWQQQSAQHRVNEALKQFGFAFLSYLEQGACSLSAAADLLQVTIAFIFKIFSFSDKKKVYNVFDRHFWDAACCIPIMFPADFMALYFIPRFAIFYCQVFIFSSIS